MIRHALILVCLATLPLAAAEKKHKDDPAAAPDLKTLMTTRGASLFEELFTPESFKMNWDVHGGIFEVVDGALRSGDKPGGDHHPQTAHRVKMHDVVVQCRFRIDGANWMGFSFGDKEHIARVMINNDQVEVVKMSGIGATTKGERLDHLPMKWEKSRWYTMLIEFRGPELIANIDNQYVLYGESPTIDADKTSILLINGGTYAWFDDLKINEAVADPKWEKRKPAVLAQKEKRK